MATKTKTRDADDDGDDYQEMFAPWVYNIPGVLMMLVGFGGLLFLTFF